MTQLRPLHAALAGATVLAGLLSGLPVAYADPAQPVDPTAQTADGATTEAKPQTADEVLAIIARDYDTGAGGGQVSNLIHSVLKLRSQGYQPSKANKAAIVKSLDYRPNQGPLVQALKETLAYQQKQQQRMAQPENPLTIGINQYNPQNPGVLGTFGVNPGGTITAPVG